MPQDDLIAALAAQQLGPEAAPPPEAAAPPPPQAPPKPQDAPPSVEEQAVEAGSPKDEADAMSAEAILYEIGGRKLTPQQIQSTFDRYRDLNFKNQEYSDLHKLAEIAQGMGMGKNPSEVARALAAMIKAQASNPTMGKGSEAVADASGVDDDELSRWEEENAAKLPPGYRDLHKNISAFGNSQMQMMQMLRQVLQGAGQMAGQGAEALNKSREERQSLIQERIASNIDRTADALGLTEDKAQDFLIFAGERGYTLDDFIDPQLTQSVMKDFKANLDTPEMERLRSIAQRRQAFTGTVQATPASSSGQAPPADANPRLNELTELALRARGVG